MLRIKGIDPDEFLNQNNDNNGDDDDDENASECSECSCEECCEEDCCDEKPTAGNPNDKTEQDASIDHSRGEAAGTSTSKMETQQSSANNKSVPDETNKRSGKDRLNVNHFRTLDQSTSLNFLIVISVEL